MAASVGKSTSMERRKCTPNDFIFGKRIGQGSFSDVFLAKEVSSEREFAIKVCDKKHILKEKKEAYIKSEREILVLISREWDETRPFFVRIHSTFQDIDRLYFVMTYARNGDLLRFIDEMAKRDIDCTQFYAGELLSAVEFLHSKGIIHRDLKPENILLNEKMHILITDFGSAKKVPVNSSRTEYGEEHSGEPLQKRSSFVGTAQYVSPEILSGRGSSRASDLWAIGCILYQMITGIPPFQSQTEYLIFQKIQKLEYCFHEGFDESARDLIKRLLVIEPTERIGAKDATSYSSIREHDFFKGLDFDHLCDATPPSVAPFVPLANQPHPVWARRTDLRPGINGMERLLIDDDSDDEDVMRRVLDTLTAQTCNDSGPGGNHLKRRHIANLSDSERLSLLEEQRKKNKYHQFVEGNLIIKQGILDKKKGLWARRRMFLLTEGPHLYYVDPDNMVLKGEIPWSKTIEPEIRDFKIFFVHTPNRIYYLIDPESKAKDWSHAINEVRNFYYGDESEGEKN